jgi:hypothetical protein
LDQSSQCLERFLAIEQTSPSQAVRNEQAEKLGRPRALPTINGRHSKTLSRRTLAAIAAEWTSTRRRRLLKRGLKSSAR